MAYGEDQEGATSKFNEAFLKMNRIHKLQDSINLASMNPTSMNEILGVYNYQIILASCNGILKECWGKLTSEERKDAVALKEAIEITLRKNPIHYSSKMVNGKTQTKFNSKNWIVLEGWLFKFDTKCRELLSRTGYDSPEDDGYDGL